jgi:hypothetical protein
MRAPLIAFWLPLVICIGEVRTRAGRDGDPVKP